VRRKSITVLILVLLGVSGAIAIIAGTSTALSGGVQGSWPTTTGLVTESYVTSLITLEDETLYAPVVIYSYDVDGLTFSYNRMTFSPSEGSPDFSWAAAIVSSYPTDSPITVRYDPADPSVNVLEPGLESSTYLLLIAGAALVLIGFGGAVYAWRSKNEVSGVRMRHTPFATYGNGLNWQACANPEIAWEEKVLWRGKPVRRSYLLSAGRQSALGGMLLLVIGLVFLVFGVGAGSGIAIVGGGFFSIAVVSIVLSLRSKSRMLPQMEYVLTNRRALSRSGQGGDTWQFVDLRDVFQVLVGQTFFDRLFKTGSLVFTDTQGVDFASIGDPQGIRKLMVEAVMEAKRQ